MKTPYILLLGFSVTLFSCSPVSRDPHPNLSNAAASSGRDYWGHRPGPKNFRTVIIDAGHGGHDSGAVSSITGQKEKDLTLDVAKRLQGELSGSFKTIMMRSSDEFIDLDDRVTRANRYGDAILVSVHFNDGPSHLQGAETYFWRVDSHGLAVRSHRAMTKLAGSGDNRGMVRRRLRLTRNPEIPCILCEGGYLSNSTEARKIQNPSYRSALAKSLAQAIKTQAAQGDAGTGPLPKPINAPPSRPSDPAGS